MSSVSGDVQQDTVNTISQDSANSSNERPYTDQGINEKVVRKIRSCIDLGKLNSSDIDNRVCEQLRSLSDDDTNIDALFNEFNNSDLTGVVNKSAFLCNFIKQWKIKDSRQTKSTMSDTQNSSDNNRVHKPGPDETKLKQIIEQTGYKAEITAGQRKYDGLSSDGPDRPEHRSEVFIGKLPRDIFEDELIPLCEKAGKIWDFRLMIDPISGFNKGYCFVTYFSSDDSTKACSQLNGYEIRPGKRIKANSSVANLRLFIGNIPKTKSKEEIRGELLKAVEGVTDVIVYAPADEAEKKKNRGFCFVDFDTHKNASAAKRKLAHGRVKVFNRDIAVDWADPDDEPDDSIMLTVKVLYVRNITSEVTENDVRDFFLPYGSIERVRKVRDYAFVHFEKREDALNAMKALFGKTLGRNTIEISLAKPLSDKRKQAQVKREQRKITELPSTERSYTQGRSNNNRPPSGSSGYGEFHNNFTPPGGRFDESFDSNNFGVFTADGHTNNASSRSRGGPNQRNNNRISRSNGMDRGGISGNNRATNFNSDNRGGSTDYNQTIRTSFNNDYRGYINRPALNHNAGGFNSTNCFNQMNSTYHHPGGFGAFNGLPQTNCSNMNNQPYGRPSNPMGMGNNTFGMNPMPHNQQYGGYIVFHHSPYTIGPVLACYAAAPPAQMTPSYFHPSISDIPKCVPFEPMISDIDEKNRKQIMFNQTVSLEQ